MTEVAVIVVPRPPLLSARLGVVADADALLPRRPRPGNAPQVLGVEHDMLDERGPAEKLGTFVPAVIGQAAHLCRLNRLAADDDPRAAAPGVAGRGEFAAREHL